MTHPLIECFEDTMRRVREDPSLAEATRQAQDATELIQPGYRDPAPQKKSDSSALEVSGDTTFLCARRLLAGRQRVAVLNFANAYTPGGGVTQGAMAQEECLCRSSNLYACLTLPAMVEGYYRENGKAYDSRGTDALIYSPGVTVFKSDDRVPVPLDEPFRVDVITCAAPEYMMRRIPDSELKALFLGRIRNILEAASAHDVDSLVLGAFGCGAFANPRRLVAEAFRAVLVEEDYRSRFRRVVFAIKCNPRNNVNLDTFRAVLAPEG